MSSSCKRTNTVYDQYERHHKTVCILHYSSLLDDTRALCHMDWLYVFNFSDIKLSLVKNYLVIYYLPYTTDIWNYNVKKYGTHLWCGAVCCGLDLVGRSVPKSPGPLFGPSPPLGVTVNADLEPKTHHQTPMSYIVHWFFWHKMNWLNVQFF